MKLHHAPEVNRAEDIDIVQDEGLFRAVGILDKEMRGLFQAAAGIEQRLLARDFNTHAEVVVRYQVLHNHVGEVMNVDYYLANSEAAQAGERDLEQRAAVDFDQRFGTIVGEGAQARAQAGGQNHRFHWSIAFIDSAAPARDDLPRPPLHPCRANVLPIAPPDIRIGAGRRYNRTTPSSA